VYFVGYVMDHAGDTYRMLDPVTKGVLVTLVVSDVFQEKQSRR
jgi:hypothetical protein